MGAGFFISFIRRCKTRSWRFWVSAGLCLMLTFGGLVSIMTSCSGPAWAQFSGCGCTAQGCTLAAPASVASVLTMDSGPALMDATFTISEAFVAQVEIWLTTSVTTRMADILLGMANFFNVFWLYDMKPSLQDQTRQLSTLDSDQSRTRTSLTDAHEQNMSQQAYQEDEHADQRKFRDNQFACEAATNFGGMQRANVIRKTLESSWTTENLPRTANEAGSPSANGPAADQNVRFVTFRTRYCNPADNNGAAGCTAAGTAPDADIDVAGTLFSKDTVDIRTANTKQNVDDLITNIVEPFAQAPVAPNTLATAQGREVFMRQQSITAKRQAARDALNFIAARRAPGSKMATYLSPLRAASGLDPTYLSDNPSYEEVMNAMITERFRSGQYQVDLVDEPENVARELVTLQALQVMQLNDQMDLMDRFAILIASEVGNEVSKYQTGADHSSNPVQ